MPSASTSVSGGQALTEKVRCRLEVLTPVHVGTGQTWNEGVDFVQKNHKVYVVNFEEYFSQLQEVGASGTKTGFDELMGVLASGKSGDVGELCNRLGIELKDISSQVFPVLQTAHDPIRPVTRTGMGTPYLPGSSIKGAIRSVLFSYLYRRFGHPEYNRFTESDLIGTFDKAITRYIRPFDVEMPQTDLANLRTFNLYLRGFAPKSDYKQNLPMTVEYFRPDTAAEFRLVVDEQWVEKLSKDLSHFLPKNIQYFIKPGRASIPHLFNLINEHTYAHLTREIAFFQAYPQAEDSDFIIENLENIRRLCANNADSCILRIGFGGGYHHITGDWRYADHTETIEKPDWTNKKRGEPTRYKSRKVIGNDLEAMLMGFVRIWLPEGYERVPFEPRQIVDRLPDPLRPKAPTNIGKTEPPQPTTKISLPPVEPKRVKFDDIRSNTVFYAKVLTISKPFCKVELLIDDYPFEASTDLSGTKGVSLQPLQYVEVLVNSYTKEGKINMVSLKK